jgi:hypothetical protein
MERDWGSLDRAQFIGFETEYRTDPMRPVAKIVVHADSHDQLGSILLALSRAVSAEQGEASEHTFGKRVRLSCVSRTDQYCENCATASQIQAQDVD